MWNSHLKRNIHSDHVIVAADQPTFIVSHFAAATGNQISQKPVSHCCMLLFIPPAQTCGCARGKAGRLEDSVVCGENTMAWEDSMIHEEEDAITHSNPFTSIVLSVDTKGERDRRV